MWYAGLAAILCCSVLAINENALGTSQSCPCPRHDLNGKRVKSPDLPEIYLIIDGQRRSVVNPETYNSLFRDWTDVTITDVKSIPLEYSLSNGASLAKSADNDAVYLISNGVKRWIVSAPVFEAFHFDWKKVVTVPKSLLDHITTGGNIAVDIPSKPCDCPQPDLNGQLVKSSDSTSVYLILDGVRRGIPNEKTFDNLFRGRKDIKVMNLTQFTDVPMLSDGATLAKSFTVTSVYLVSNEVKRGITCEKTFEKYHSPGTRLLLCHKLLWTPFLQVIISADDFDQPRESIIPSVNQTKLSCRR